MTYDPTDGYVLMFGGGVTPSLGILHARVVNETWKFSAGIWSQLHLAKSPSARWQPMMGFDGAIRLPVLIGGQSHTGAMLNDSWK